jgi:hypothetical protein
VYEYTVLSRSGQAGRSPSIYDQILSEVTDDLERRILKYLSAHPDQPVRREQIIRDIFGRNVEREKLAADHDDRKLRLAISNLQKNGAPILASASSAGYVFSDDPEQLSAYIAELESRREELSRKIEGLRRSRQAVIQQPQKAEQPSFWG